MYVCMSSVTLVHHTKAVGRNEMQFDRDTHVVPSNIVLEQGPVSPTESVDLGDRNPSSQQMLPNAKLLWPWFRYSFYCHLLWR